MTIETRRLLGGRFALDTRIGSGNYAEIFRATDIMSGNLVAIKTLRLEHANDQHAVSLFLKEGEVGTRISHPNVVRIWSHGVEDDVYYIVMELVRGISLRRRLKLSGSLSISESLRILQAILRGLEAAHDAGYIHRDIKPQNILLDVSGTPKITDFGIALGPDQPMRLDGCLALGTAAYIAPEQAVGEKTGPQADVYSAGSVLFEMLTGEPPFPGEDPLEVMNRHLFEPPRDPRNLNPEISPALAAVITRTLAKDPAARFSSALRMREALELLQPELVPRAPVARLVPAGNLAWTIPLAPSRRLPERLLGMPALTTFVSALLLVVLIIVLMLALVSSVVTASDSESRISSSDQPSGVIGGSTPFDDLRATPSRASALPEVKTVPNWAASAAVGQPMQTPVTASNPVTTPTATPTAVTASATATPVATPTPTPEHQIVDVSSKVKPPVAVNDGDSHPIQFQPSRDRSADNNGPITLPVTTNSGDHRAPQPPHTTNQPGNPPKPPKSDSQQKPPKHHGGGGDKHVTKGHHGHD